MGNGSGKSTELWYRLEPRQEPIRAWDVFGTDVKHFQFICAANPLQTGESVHDSSSGIASDVTPSHPNAPYLHGSLQGGCGGSSSSDKLSQRSQDSGTKTASWPSCSSAPHGKTANHYVQMHMKSRRSPAPPPPLRPAPKQLLHHNHHIHHHQHQQHQQLQHHNHHGPRFSPRSGTTGGSGSAHPQPIEAQVQIVTSGVRFMELQNTERAVSGKGGKRLAQRLPLFDFLGDDVVLKILWHLPTDHLCRCARVCRRWYHLVWEPSLWTAIVINDYAGNMDRVLKYLTRRLSYNTPTVCVILERVSLSGCQQLTDKGVRTLAKRCPELRRLELQGCSNVTNVGIFEVVSYCVNMEHLDVTGCHLVTCVSLLEDVMAASPSRHLQQIYLRYLDMTDCYALDDRGLAIIARHCSQLHFLYLRRCVQVSDEGVAAVANHCCSLREFSVSDCRRVTDLGLRELSRLGDNLRYLSVAKCERVSDVGVRYIAQHCPKLRYLNVRGCEAVSDESICLLATNCPRLRSLDIGKCDITDEGLRMLAEHCPQLRKLSLKACEAVTDRGIVLVAYHCQGLQQINVQDCHLSLEAYRMVKRYCRRCFIEHTNPAIY